MVLPKKPDEFAAFVWAYDACVRDRLRLQGVRDVDVDDMAQEVFLVAYRYPDELEKTPGRVRSWIASVVFRVASNSRRNHWNIHVECVDHSTLDTITGATGGEIETSAMALEWLASLTPLQRHIAALQIQGFSCDEIARETGVSRSWGFNLWQRSLAEFFKEGER